MHTHTHTSICTDAYAQNQNVSKKANQKAGRHLRRERERALQASNTSQTAKTRGQVSTGTPALGVHVEEEDKVSDTESCYYCEQKAFKGG